MMSITILRRGSPFEAPHGTMRRRVLPSRRRSQAEEEEEEEEEEKEDDDDDSKLSMVEKLSWIHRIKR